MTLHPLLIDLLTAFREEDTKLVLILRYAYSDKFFHLAFNLLYDDYTNIA